MRLVQYPDRAAQARGLAAVVAAQLRDALAADGRASLALPGGTTPAAFMEALAAEALDWGAVTAFPADERWVPPGHPRSNAALIRAHLARGPAAAVRIADLWTGDATPASGIAPLTARLAPHLPPTVLVLGMGNDLHVASLFPGAPGIAAALAPDAPPVVAMEGPPAVPGEGPEPRVSLSLPAMSGARHRYLLIVGPEKRAALERALAARDFAQAPVAALLPDLEVHWSP